MQYRVHGFQVKALGPGTNLLSVLDLVVALLPLAFDGAWFGVNVTGFRVWGLGVRV